MTAYDSSLLRRLVSGLALSLAVLLAAPVARADDTTPPPDSTAPAGDTTAPADPGTTPPADTGTTPPADTGTTPPADTGTTPPADTGTTPPADTGTTPPPADTGTATTPPADTGTTTPPADTGSTTPGATTGGTEISPTAGASTAPAANKSYGIDKLTGVPIGSSGPREEAHVLIQRKDRAEGKSELSLALPVLVNGKFVNEVGTGLEYLYHFRETFALGVGGTFFPLAQNSSFTDDELLQKAQQSPVVADALIMRYELHAGMEMAPIYGKFALFNLGVAQFGIYLGAGAGVTQTRVELQYDPKTGNRSFGDTGFLPMGYLNAGFRLFFSQHIALRLEIRDYIFAAAVNHINGCTSTDLSTLKGNANGPVSTSCNARAFQTGSDPNTLQTNSDIARQLISDLPTDSVLNNLMFTAAVSVLF